MILDFWNTNLNPVTMLPKETNCIYTYGKRLLINDTEYKHEDLSLNPLYVGSIEVQKVFGVGAKKLKNMLNREYFRDIKGIKYCLRTSVDELEKSIKSVINDSDISDYIHSQELKEILGIDTMQLFTLSNRNNWKKRKFKGKGTGNYFLRSEVLK